MAPHTPLKVLIIKTGWTETLTNEPFKEGVVSLGDVLRTTALLHVFETDHITWLTDAQARPLLVNNPYINRLLDYNLPNQTQIMAEQWDIVVNLEKHPGMAGLSESLKAWQKYGFRLDSVTGRVSGYTHAANALYRSETQEHDGNHWLYHLYKMTGRQWEGQGYILNHEASSTRKALVGLNNRTGSKFQGKKWPRSHWFGLSDLLDKEGITSSWQPQETTIKAYMNWINEHCIIVTNDSLGLHIAMALNKRVVGLFGPTSTKDIHPYEKGIMIQAEIPGDSLDKTEHPEAYKSTAMGLIKPQTVCEAIKELLSWGQS